MKDSFQNHRNCNGITRRNCLQFGLTAAVGTGLADLLSLRAVAADSGKKVPVKAKSCILQKQGHWHSVDETDSDFNLNELLLASLRNAHSYIMITSLKVAALWIKIYHQRMIIEWHSSWQHDLSPSDVVEKCRPYSCYPGYDD